jgi:hypothetical protein
MPGARHFSRCAKQYHFWPAEQGFDAWDVDRLVELSRGLPVERVPRSQRSTPSTGSMEVTSCPRSATSSSTHALSARSTSLIRSSSDTTDGSWTACTGLPARYRSLWSALPWWAGCGQDNLCGQTRPQDRPTCNPARPPLLAARMVEDSRRPPRVRSRGSLIPSSESARG